MREAPAGRGTGTVRAAGPSDLDACVDVLTAAFADYPFSWRAAAAGDRHARLRAYQELLLREVGLPHGRVHVLDGPGGIDAVAVWSVPGDEPAAPVPGACRPEDPVWFLTTVGVRPARQGRGLGRAVLAPGLAAADAAGRDAFLETADPANVAIYTRWGFRVVAEEVPPHGGPRTWGMRRPAGGHAG